MKALTLNKFWENNTPDGYYAVWKSRIIQSCFDKNSLYGFSGGIAKFTNQGGFEDYPEWMDDTDENYINIILLEELPNVEDLQSSYNRMY